MHTQLYYTKLLLVSLSFKVGINPCVARASQALTHHPSLIITPILLRSLFNPLAQSIQHAQHLHLYPNFNENPLSILHFAFCLETVIKNSCYLELGKQVRNKMFSLKFILKSDDF